MPACRHYHAGLSAEERESVQREWSMDKVQVRNYTHHLPGQGQLLSPALHHTPLPDPPIPKTWYPLTLEGHRGHHCLWHGHQQA